MEIVVWLIGVFLAFCLVMRRAGDREKKREVLEQKQAKEVEESLKKEKLASEEKLASLANKYK